VAITERVRCAILLIGCVLASTGVGAQSASSNGRSERTLAAAACVPTHMVDVRTHRNNNARTGANLDESCLTPENVTAKTFGKLFTMSVRGQVYAQPLIATNVPLASGPRNIAYIATMQNWVYAFDADGGHRDPHGIPQPYWSVQLGPPLPVQRIPKDVGAWIGKYNISPFVGITSTPVIDRSSNTLVLVAKIARVLDPGVVCDAEVSSDECPIVYQIVALDLSDGSIRDSKEIRLPEPEKTEQGQGCGLFDSRKTTALDAARINLQRPALLMTTATDGRNRIYLGFGSHQDAPCPMYHGMLIGFQYDGHTLTQFPDDHRFLVSALGEIDTGTNDPAKLGKGGIWQAGNGPAADDAGNVYVMTGNGSFDANRQFGSSFVKLDPDLAVNGWFAPANVKKLNSDSLDIDLGSAGPVLLQGSDDLVGGGKQGKLYLLDSSNLGGQQRGGWPHEHTNPPLQYFWGARRWSLSWYWLWGFVPIPLSLLPGAWATGFHHIHGSPAFWGDSTTDLHHGALYVWPERDHLKAFSYSRTGPHGAFATKPSAVGPEAGRGMPGGMLSISANGSDKPGILWAALPLHDDAWIDIVRGTLRAFKITPDGKTITPIWTSYCADKDDRFDFAKYVPPTVANGKVYLATFSDVVNVYGPRQQSVSAKDAPTDCPISDFSVNPDYKRTNRASKTSR
jgi:hypothetical protein